MSDSKKDSFLSRIGEGIAESIGVRHDESSVLPAYNEATTARRDYTVDRQIGSIAIDKVLPDPDQPRKDFDQQSIDQLAEDIKNRTQLQPIGVRSSMIDGEARWLIIYGERRWRACKQAGLDHIKCRFFTEDINENEIRAIQLCENLQRSDLSILETANGFQSLMQLNAWTAKQVAEHLHISPTKVSRMLKLLDLPTELQTKINDGTIAASTAYHVAKEKNATKRTQLIDKAMAGELDEESARTTTTKSKDGAKTRRTTNETYRVSHGIRVTVCGRKYVDANGVIGALLEAIEQQRAKTVNEKRVA